MFHMEFVHLSCHQVGRVLQKDFLFHLLVYFLLISEHLDNSKYSEKSKKMWQLQNKITKFKKSYLPIVAAHPGYYCPQCQSFLWTRP